MTIVIAVKVVRVADIVIAVEIVITVETASVKSNKIYPLTQPN